MQYWCETTFGTVYMSYLHTAQQACCVYTISKALSLKWKPQCIESCLPLFIARVHT